MSKQNKKQEKMDDFIQNTLQGIRNLIDANVIVGTAIKVGKSTIIPINKLTVGYITGGGEVCSKKTPQFSVGSTSGFNITPMGFIFVEEKSANFIPIQPSTVNDKLFETVIKVINERLKKSSGENGDEK